MIEVVANASGVAQFIRDYSAREGDPVPDASLNTLMYYAQAWHLAVYDRKLFDDAIVAGEDGPVVEFGESAGELDADGREHVERIMKRYGSMNCDVLRQLAQCQPPWIVARQRALMDPRMQIRDEGMKLFYRLGGTDLVTRGAILLCRAASGISAFGFDSSLASQ